jgi:hypothetical protein
VALIGPGFAGAVFQPVARQQASRDHPMIMHAAIDSPCMAGTASGKV